MRNASRRSLDEARRRQGQHRDEAVAGVGELKAVADRILETGARYLERGRDFLTRNEDMNRHRDKDWERESSNHESPGARGVYGADPREGARDARDERWLHQRAQGDSGRREAGIQPPDEYAFAETGSGAAGGGYGYEEEDRRTRDYDERVDALARSRNQGRRAAPWPTDGREEWYAGASGRRAHRGPAGDDERSLRGNFGYGYGGSAYGSGFEEPRTGIGRDYEAQGLRSQRGRGPRGYRRSDERVLEDVNERLSDDPLLDASDIEVRCEDGRVTLEGQVEDRWMKHRAEDIADSVSGARDVDNRIRVVRGAAPWNEAPDREASNRRGTPGGTARTSGAGTETAKTASGTSATRGSTPPAQQPH